MAIYKQYNFGNNRGNPMGPFVPLLFLAIILFLLYFIAKGIFALLYWAAPVLFILALIIDYRVFTDYIKFVINLLKSKPLMGVILILLSIIGYPVLSGFLFFKALMRRQIKKLKKESRVNTESTYTEYEVVDEDDMEEDFLELPQQSQQKQERREGNSYDNLFD